MTFLTLLKNIFFFLLFLQFVPPLIEGISKQYSSYLIPKTKVAIVSINSPIEESNSYNKQLHEYFKNNEIKAILLKIDCGGGAAGSSQAIHDELKALKKEYPKPVISLVENMCASGAYYIASATDFIVAPGSALIGSIGATLPNLFQVKDLLEQIKIRYVSIKAGTYKTIGDPFVDMTAQEKELLQDILQNSYQQFAHDVATNRNLSAANLNVWADGKIFSGKQAVTVGLIDEIGSAYTATKMIKQKALIDGEIEWVKTAEEKTLSNLLFGGSQKDQSSDSMFSMLIQTLYTMLHANTKIASEPRLTY